MKRILYFWFFLVLAAGCHYSTPIDSLTLIQIQDRNGLTETISNADRLAVYETADFLSSQPYKKVLRVYKKEGKNHSKITTYHPNGTVWQYLEAEEMRAHGAFREWFANGQLKIEATVIGGTADVALGAQEDWLFDGLSQVWDEQGNLLAKIPYQKGVLEGISLYYYPSGCLAKQIPFVKNSMEGEGLEYAENGALKSKTNYIKGVKEGESLGFFEEEKLAWIEEYTDGCLLLGTYYSPQGELIANVENGGGFQARYENNALTLMEFRIGKPEGLMQKFTSAKELQRSFHLKNGKKQGEEIEFYLLSQVCCEKDRDIDLAKKERPLPKLSVMWNENTIHGCVKTWYNNGQLQSQREYSHNQRIGSSLAWYRSGQLMMLEEYEEGRLVKGQYFKIHKAQPVSTIANGNGIATLYDEAGVFLKKIQYAKGKPVDPEN